MKWTRIDLSGKTFGRLHVTRFVGADKEGRALYGKPNVYAGMSK